MWPRTVQYVNALHHCPSSGKYSHIMEFELLFLCNDIFHKVPNTLVTKTQQESDNVVVMHKLNIVYI